MTAGSSTVGLIAVLVSCVFFGSNFVVTKKYKTGDGMFFQLCLCIGIWFTGLLVNFGRDFPAFQPIAMLGGVIWACGNVCVVPIVKAIGLSKGLLLWGSTNMLTGWASGKFGYYVIDLPKEPIANPTLNYIGVLIGVVSLVIYSFIDTAGGGVQDNGDASAPLLPQTGQRGSRSSTSSGGGGGGHSVEIASPTDGPRRQGNDASDDIWVDHLSKGKRAAVGIGLSIWSGILYGLNFDPPTWVKAHVKGASPHLIDYVFSHFTGILLTSIVFFVIYLLWTKNNPMVFPNAIGPAMLSGVMWAVAQTSWFVANNDLSLVIAFPLVSMGPGIVGALWGVFAFKEITGTRNYLILLAAVAVAGIAAVVLVVSKG